MHSSFGDALSNVDAEFSGFEIHTTGALVLEHAGVLVLERHGVPELALELQTARLSTKQTLEHHSPGSGTE